MRHYPDDKYGRADAKRINAEPWQLGLLKLNPGYCAWGPHEDYMIKKAGSGWDAPVFSATWKEHQFGLDDMNECVNFYFAVHRASRECGTCNGSGYHPDAQWVSESFYGHSTPFRARTMHEVGTAAYASSFGIQLRDGVVSGFPTEGTLAKYPEAFRQFCEEMRDSGGEWNDKITEDEAKALVKEGRGSCDKLKTADDFNQAQHGRGLSGHDAINRSILIEARCKRLGVPKTCNSCEGHGEEYIEPNAHVSLTLWMLHPRKGCSRGVEIARITQDDLPDVFAWLKKAAARNAERFAAIK